MVTKFCKIITGKLFDLRNQFTRNLCQDVQGRREMTEVEEQFHDALHENTNNYKPVSTQTTKSCTWKLKQQRQIRLQGKKKTRKGTKIKRLRTHA